MSRRVDEILAAIDAAAPVLEATAGEAEAAARAPTALVDCLRALRVPMLKVPAACGGDELAPVDQLLVIEALARRNPTAGWVGFNTAGAAGRTASALDDEALEEVFGNGSVPFFAAAAVPTGTYTRVDDGTVRASGTWPFASGVTHADWMLLTALDADDPRAVRILVVPRAALTVHGTWDVIALQGTGSLDVTLDAVSVPARRAIDVRMPPRRGGAMYAQPFQVYVAGENTGFTLGTAARFFDELVALAHRRSKPGGGVLAEAAVFRHELAEGRMRLDAARAYALGVLAAPASDAQVRAMTAFVTATAADVVGALFRHAGASALRRPSALERAYRDTLGSAQHVVASTAAFEPYGASLLG